MNGWVDKGLLVIGSDWGAGEYMVHVVQEGTSVIGALIK
jgi:hypothetical protein